MSGDMSGGAAMSRNSIPPASVGQANVFGGTSGTCMSRNSLFTPAPTFQGIVSSAVTTSLGRTMHPVVFPYPERYPTRRQPAPSKGLPLIVTKL